MNKYTHIYDNIEKNQCRWTNERAYEISDIIFGFCKNFVDGYGKKPEIVGGLTLGLTCWNILTTHPRYDNAEETFRLFDLIIPVKADWSVDMNYIELNLK
jgi:hypothetical protein